MVTEKAFAKDVVHINQFVFYDADGKEAPYEIVWWGYDKTARGTTLEPEGDNETHFGYGIVEEAFMHDDPEGSTHLKKKNLTIKFVGSHELLINEIHYYAHPLTKEAIAKLALIEMQSKIGQFTNTINNFLEQVDELSKFVEGVIHEI